MQPNSYLEMLRALIVHEVEFVVVGGVAAVLLGVPHNTFDLDIVHSRKPENIHRLLTALAKLDAVYRFKPELKPDASHLSSPGHQLLMTKFGAADCLGAIGQQQGYLELLPHCVEVPLEERLIIKVLDLETQIAIKEQLTGDRDKLILPLLRRTLEESRKT